ncbi:MAG: ATP-binding protein [Oscillospiraceae bacterium]|nr:ATP-binding protein [Oscillospiraceae bacterium]
MSLIIIPEKFKEKLPNGSFVYALLRNVERQLWATDYFPEYTLHDESHINAVLDYETMLIPQKILDDMHPQAIEILISATALHDLGMFIKRDGLKRLIFGQHKSLLEEHLDKKSWNGVWKEFYGKARRYNDRELMRLFGNTDSVENLPDDDIPVDDTKPQRLLYGEFIRSNHARLALHIAQFGFPGYVDIDMFENCDCQLITKKIIGLVARGHGMKTLREADKYLENLSSLPRRIPYHYLIAILQIADTLDIGSDRAPIERELTDELSSPESKRQFRLNQAINNKPFFEIEKKRVCIDAEPKCSATFIDVEALLRKIQRELDNNWAVLTERYEDKYKFTIHRVESNMFDDARVASITQGYLARGASLGANPDIVKLLVEPLYNNNPSFGVRELVQNAIDACMERKKIDGTDGNIIVKIDTEKQMFSITDNGIGMNSDVLRNYYLIAGASYRFSDRWRDKFLENHSKAIIARNGRFGIGALAAFLIGDEINVTTRYYKDKSGYKFMYTMKPELLNVHREDTDVGTVIEIKMKESSQRYFNDVYENNPLFKEWVSWYAFDKPNVSYYLNGKQIVPELLNSQMHYTQEISDNSKLSCSRDEIIDENGWLAFQSSIFNKIFWSYEKSFLSTNLGSDKKVFYNGMPISSIESSYHVDKDHWDNSHWSIIRGFGFDIHMPSMSIIDNDSNGKLPIDISRNVILDFPIEEVFIEDIYKYFLAQVLCIPLERHACFVWEGKHGYIPLAYCDKGFTICARTFALHTKEKIWLIIGNDISDDANISSPFAVLDNFHGRDNSSLHYNCSYGPQGKIFINGELIYQSDENSLFEMLSSIITSAEPTGYKSCCGKILAYDNGNNSLDMLPRKDRKCCEVEADTFLSIPINAEEEASDSDIARVISKDNPLAIEYIPKPIGDTEKNILMEILQKYLPFERNGGWIPLDIDERKRIYPEAFEELKRYMES